MAKATIKKTITKKTITKTSKKPKEKTEPQGWNNLDLGF